MINHFPVIEYRLDNQNGDPSLGRVMGLYNGTWAPVCTNYRWDNQDARVLCKSLGYDTGVAASSRHFPKPPPPTTTASPRSPDQRGEAGLAVSGPRGQRGEAGVRGPPGPPGTSPVHPPLRWALTFNCGGEERSLFDCPGRWETYCYNEAGALCFNNVTSREYIYVYLKVHCDVRNLICNTSRIDKGFRDGTRCSYRIS